MKLTELERDNWKMRIKATLADCFAIKELFEAGKIKDIPYEKLLSDIKMLSNSLTFLNKVEPIDK